MVLPRLDACRPSSLGPNFTVGGGVYLELPFLAGKTRLDVLGGFPVCSHLFYILGHKTAALRVLWDVGLIGIDGTLS